MATKIKLQRLGKMREPHYRVVVADSRTKRDGRVIETIGQYHPKNDPSIIIIDGERAKYWLSVGAQPTEPVAALLKVTGDWQSFKGLPAPAPMLMAAPKADKKILFEATAKEGAGIEEKLATTTKAAKKDAKVAEVLAAEPEADAPGQVAGAGTSSAAAIVIPKTAAPETLAAETAASEAAATETAAE